MTKAARLRHLMASGEMVIAPGAYDCITAKLIERAGFPAVYMTGGGTSASLGYPDFGLTTLNEIADNASRIANAVDIPVISDADNGYGNELNAFRTVREFEQRGVAALHIEDQVFPKKCGHLDNKQVIPLDEYLAKIRAAAAARQNPDTVIIARTDSRAILGFEEAVQRMNESLAAGADVAFLEAPLSMEETARIPREVNGLCLLNVVRRSKSPLLDLEEAKRMGYAIAIVPTVLWTHILGSCEKILRELRETNVHPVTEGDLSVMEMFERGTIATWMERQKRFGSS
jgi:2-methylisocitrate lyase-like PEP mutase family enzyme